MQLSNTKMLIRRRLLSQFLSKPKEVTLVKRFTQSDLDAFSKLTGDYNILHSEQIAADKRLVHGALLNAVVAGIIGTQLPGTGTIVVEQQLKFPKPCRIETDSIFKVRLMSARKLAQVEYECRQGDNVVFQGEAKLIMNSN